MYRQTLSAGSAPGPVTAESSGLRYADYVWDSKHQRVVAVAEQHDPSDHAKVDNFIVAIGECGLAGKNCGRDDV